MINVKVNFLKLVELSWGSGYPKISIHQSKYYRLSYNILIY